MKNRSRQRGIDPFAAEFGVEIPRDGEHRIADFLGRESAKVELPEKVVEWVEGRCRRIDAARLSVGT